MDDKRAQAERLRQDYLPCTEEEKREIRVEVLKHYESAFPGMISTEMCERLTDFALEKISEVSVVYDRAVAAGKDPLAALMAYNPMAYANPETARSMIALMFSQRAGGAA